LFLIYDKAYQLLKEDSKKDTKEVISGIYSIVQNSELGKRLKEVMDNSNQLSLLNILANPKGTPVFSTEEKFEKKILVNIRNLLDRNTTLNDSDKELALTQFVVDLYSSTHGVKIKNENLVSLPLCSLPLHITNYISYLNDVIHKLPSSSVKVTAQELSEYHSKLNFYPITLQKQKFVEAFECLLTHNDANGFERILTSSENMLCNLEGGTVLHLAAKLGYTDIVNDLIKNVEDINPVNGDGQTPLHLAAQNGHIDIVRALIEKGAKIDAVNKLERTPLHLAARNGHIGTVRALIEKGARIDATDKHGQTPLHLAAQNGHIDIVRALIEKGANPLLKNGDGKTPRELATNDDIEELLKEAEKKYQEKQAFVRGLAAGCSIAVLGAVVAVALFATGTIVAGLMSIIGAVAIVTAVALAVGDITYGLLKPSTEVNKAKEENLKGNKVPPPV